MESGISTYRRIIANKLNAVNIITDAWETFRSPQHDLGWNYQLCIAHRVHWKALD
jgi:hypothetical protein